MRFLVSLVAVLAFSACPPSPASDAGVPPPDAGGPASDGGAFPSDGGLVDELTFLESCQALSHDCASRDAGARCGQCQVRLAFDPAQCTAAQPCDRLMVLWAAMDCEAKQVEDLLTQTAHRPGWLAACVQPLFPGEMLPSTLGAPARDEASLSAVFDTLKVQRGVWSGKDLLFTGCSAGATRYPVVAARTTADTQWLASRSNAACFSEGVFDIAYQDRFIGEGMLDGGTSCASRHRRMVEAFTQPTPQPGHSCAASPGGQCACDPSHATRSWAGDCGTGDCLAFESIVAAGPGGTTFASGVGAADFAVPHWKLVSEGSDFEPTSNRCLRDVVPETPLAGLCTLLDADPAKTCAASRFPSSPHCGSFWNNLPTECLDWFEQL